MHTNYHNLHILVLLLKNSTVKISKVHTARQTYIITYIKKNTPVVLI